VLEALPKLRILSILGTGTDNVDLAAATERGIAVTNTPGASTVSVAELALGLVFAVARHIPLADRKVREGVWYHREAMELRSKTLGVVGLGLIGQEVARLAGALGLRVIAWSYTHDPERAERCGAELVELDELLSQADIISLHLRAAPEAEGLIGRRELGLMKPSAILINTARASLVDQGVLIEALKEGRITGAGFDTFWQEPVPEDSPLLELESFVLSPHVGWVTHEASARLRKMPVDNIIAFLEGDPVHVVNPEALG
jgi:D-3-phosphoglycerate dehydrogenase